MARITWNLPAGNRIAADVESGTSLMDAAVASGVPGILGECGGCLSCATCHVFVDPDWIRHTGEADAIETSMLEMTDVPRTRYSRLSCQIIASEQLDGLVLNVPGE